MWLYTYNPGSEGAKELASALKVTRIKNENSIFKGSPKKTVINWGSTELPEEVMKCRIINSPDAIRKYSHKLNFFNEMYDTIDGPRIPQFTTNRTRALEWFQEDGLVVCRRNLTASGALGLSIPLEENGDEVPSVPLYTRYVKKKDEYRVHFFGKEIIDFQRKALRTDYSERDVNWRVRNLENGFVFVRSEVELPDDVRTQALRTINAVTLDFGAIDIIYNERRGEAYVLEINTAPGLVGSTVQSYANAFNSTRENKVAR